MRVLSLWQPWATLIALGAKRYETRHFPVEYRGPVAIHATRKWDRDTRALCETSAFRQALAPEAVRLWPGISGDRAVEGRKALALYLKHAGSHPRALPLGAIVAVADLVECWWINRGPHAVQLRSRDGLRAAEIPLGTPEVEFGDYSPRRAAWELVNVRPLSAPYPLRGRQTVLWALPAAEQEAVRGLLPVAAEVVHA